jgi:hypothetical protein
MKGINDSGLGSTGIVEARGDACGEMSCKGLVRRIEQ